MVWFSCLSISWVWQFLVHTSAQYPATEYTRTMTDVRSTAAVDPQLVHANFRIISKWVFTLEASFLKWSWKWVCSQEWHQGMLALQHYSDEPLLPNIIFQLLSFISVVLCIDAKIYWLLISCGPFPKWRENEYKTLPLRRTVTTNTIAKFSHSFDIAQFSPYLDFSSKKI